MDDAQHALRFVPAWSLRFHADQCAVERHAVDERLRAVDRVQNPATTARAGAIRKFFAEDRVVGKRRGNSVSQQLLGLPIGHGHGRRIGLAFHGQIGLLKITQRMPAGFRRRRSRHFKPA